MKILTKEQLGQDKHKGLLCEGSVVSFYLLEQELREGNNEQKIKTKFNLSVEDAEAIDRLIKQPANNNVLLKIKMLLSNIRLNTSFEKDFDFIFDNNSIISNGGRSKNYILQLCGEKNENLHVIFSVSDMGVFCGINKAELKKMNEASLSVILEFIEIASSNPSTLKPMLLYGEINDRINSKSPQKNMRPHTQKIDCTEIGKIKI